METIDQGPARRTIVVVGASRSGTSVAARALKTLGVDLGDRLRKPSWRNPRGFYEHRGLLDLSARLRRSVGLGPHSVALIEPERWRRPKVQALGQEAAEIIRRHFGASPLWGFKDGRTLRMLPFWEEVFATLGLDVHYLLAVRNPLSVAWSRLRLEDRKPFTRRLTREHWELLWLVYVVPYFRRLGTRPLVVVDYDRIMAAPEAELDRIARALKLPPPTPADASVREFADGFLSARLRHSRFTVEDLARDAHFSSLTPSAYRWLRRLASDEIGADEPTLWREWRDLEAELGELAPLLGDIDRRNRGLHGVRFNPGALLHRLAG
ncbi:MAG: sulfotransferase family protein [Alphaproteobacteria bacterium]